MMCQDKRPTTDLELAKHYIDMAWRFIADYHERKDCPTYEVHGELHGAEVCTDMAEFFLNKHIHQPPLPPGERYFPF
jgi:hypothetical protein